MTEVKVKNMKSRQGNDIPNQFIIETEDGTYFQSYQTIIVKKDYVEGKTFLDENAWNFSKTTSKYRALFLGETTKETEAKIKSGRYILANLNK